MAYAVSPTLAAAIVSPQRRPVTELLIWLGGDAAAPTDFSYLVSDCSVERSPSDSPEQASRFAGSIAAQASVTLEWLGDSIPGGDGRIKSREFLPYVGTLTSFRDRDYGIGMKVKVRRGFITPAGAEYVPSFVGRIDGVTGTSVAAVTLRCLDFAVDLQGQLTLPTAAVATGSPALPLYSVVELALRTGGFHCTPPPLSDCVLSVPSMLPEIGDVAAPLVTEVAPLSNFGRYCAPPADNRYVMTSNYAPRPGQFIVIEGWFKAAAVAGLARLVTIADGVTGPNGSLGGLKLSVDATGAVTASPINDSVNLRTAAGAWPSDGAWHYLLIRVQPGANSTGCFVRVDATDYSTTWSSFSNRGDMQPSDNGSRIAILGGLPHEGVSIRMPSSIDYVQTPRNTWTPNYQTALLGTSPGIMAIPRGQTGSAWDVIRQVAVDTGAVCRWKEDATWRYEERASLIARRIAAAAGDYDDTRALTAAGYGYDAASRRGSVVVDYTEYSLLRSTVALPAWAAVDVITVQPRRTDVLTFDTDNPVVGIATLFQTSVLSNGYSSFQVVPAYQVPDPAAQIVTGVTIQITPTATGFRAAIRNPLSQAISLWDPTTGAPALSLQGWTVTGKEPRRLTAGATPKSKEVLELQSSAWRQNRGDASQMANDIAGETSMPAVVFEQIQVVSDPSLTVDDIIRVRAPAIMDALVPCQIIGISGSDYESTLTVRACYPPTGWVLGVPGRSELGSTTKLTA